MRLLVLVTLAAVAVAVEDDVDYSTEHEESAVVDDRAVPTHRQLQPDDEFGKFELLPEDFGFFSADGPKPHQRRPTGRKPGRRPSSSRFPSKRRPQKNPRPSPQREGAEDNENKKRQRGRQNPVNNNNNSGNNNNNLYRDREGITGFINAFRRLFERMIE